MKQGPGSLRLRSLFPNGATADCMCVCLCSSVYLRCASPAALKSRPGSLCSSTDCKHRADVAAWGTTGVAAALSPDLRGRTLVTRWSHSHVGHTFLGTAECRRERQLIFCFRYTKYRQCCNHQSSPIWMLPDDVIPRWADTASDAPLSNFCSCVWRK